LDVFQNDISADEFIEMVRNEQDFQNMKIFLMTDGFENRDLPLGDGKIDLENPMPFFESLSN